MRILMCNARLGQRAGSELASLEIARAHRRAGHEVALFTLRPGELSAQFSSSSGVPVFDMNQRDALIEFQPELLHVHHWPTVVTLEWLGIVAPWVIGFLGSLTPLENPPALLPGKTVPWWTLNPVGQLHYQQIPGWADSPHRVVGNWFDDSSIPEKPGIIDRNISRVLVVSNHFPEESLRALHQVGDTLGFTLTHVGLPNNSRAVDPDLISSFDAVVTIGRTALLAMALGTPVLILDHFGADGWVTPDSVNDLSRHNFSGRWQRLTPTNDRLQMWFEEPPDASDRLKMQEWAFANAAMSKVLSDISTLYAEPCKQTPSQVFGLGILAVGELLVELESSHMQIRHGIDDATMQRGNAIAQRDAALAERDRVIIEKKAITESRIWRATEWYRRLRAR